MIPPFMVYHQKYLHQNSYYWLPILMDNLSTRLNLHSITLPTILFWSGTHLHHYCNKKWQWQLHLLKRLCTMIKTIHFLFKFYLFLIQDENVRLIMNYMKFSEFHPIIDQLDFFANIISFSKYCSRNHERFWFFQGNFQDCVRSCSLQLIQLME